MFSTFNPAAASGNAVAAIDRSQLLALGSRARSLTSQREARPILVGADALHFADVAQLVARDLAKVEATGSIPVIRSMTISGVPVHKHWAGLVGMCAGAAAPACSGDPACRVIACGHSRDGSCLRSSAGRAGHS